jgi:hypothetical protein
MANWNKKNTGRPALADNARASIELIADRIDNLEKGLAGDETLTSIDIKGGTIDNTPIGVNTPKAGAFTDITASGNITNTGDYKYSSTKTKTITYGVTQFNIIDYGVSTKPYIADGALAGGSVTQGTNVILGLPIDAIPIGATITNITWWMKAGSGDWFRFRCKLNRVKLSDGVADTVGDTGSDVAIYTNYTSVSTNMNVTIDADYAYSVYADVHEFHDGGIYRIYSAKITYTIDEL